MQQGVFPRWLVGITTFLVMLILLLFWGGLILVPVAVLKLLLGFEPFRTPLDKALAWIATRWVGSNQLVFRILHRPRRRLSFDAAVDPARSYLLICNHQSWADILILFDVFHGRTPFLRFFLKQELIWIPLVGWICWTLDMPFMKRHSAAAIAANPGLREEDLNTTREFCSKFRNRPITIVNFLEGTRFTPSKKEMGNAPYKYLLKPKTAGMSFTLNAMGEQFDGIIDVTMTYEPTCKPLLWSWLCGEQSRTRIEVNQIEIPDEMIHGDYDQDADFRDRFRNWVFGLWADKDRRLTRQRQVVTPDTD